MGKKVAIFAGALLVLGAGLTFLGYNKAQARVCFVDDANCSQVSTVYGVDGIEACTNMGYTCHNTEALCLGNMSGPVWSWASNRLQEEGGGFQLADSQYWKKVSCPMNHSYFTMCPKGFYTSCPPGFYKSTTTCANGTLHDCLCRDEYKYIKSPSTTLYTSNELGVKNCTPTGTACQDFLPNGSPSQKVKYAACECMYPYAYTETACSTQFHGSTVPEGDTDYCTPSSDLDNRYYKGCECNRNFYVYAEDDDRCPEGVDTSLKCQDSTSRFYYHSCKDCSCYPVEGSHSNAELEALGVLYEYANVLSLNRETVTKGNIGCVGEECRTALIEGGYINNCNSGNAATCMNTQAGGNQGLDQVGQNYGSVNSNGNNNAGNSNSGVSREVGDTNERQKEVNSTPKASPKGGAVGGQEIGGSIHNQISYTNEPWAWDDEVKVDGVAYSYVTCPYNTNKYRILYCYEPGMRPSQSCDVKQDDTLSGGAITYYKPGEACVPISCEEALDAFLKTSAGAKYAKFDGTGVNVATENETHYLVDGYGRPVVERYVNTHTGGKIQYYIPETGNTVSRGEDPIEIDHTNYSLKYYFSSEPNFAGRKDRKSYSRRTAIITKDVSIDGNSPDYTKMQGRFVCDYKGCKDSDGNFWQVRVDPYYPGYNDAEVVNPGSHYHPYYLNTCTKAQLYYYWDWIDPYYSEASYGYGNYPEYDYNSSVPSDMHNYTGGFCGYANREGQCNVCLRNDDPYPDSPQVHKSNNCVKNGWTADKTMTLQTARLGENCIHSHLDTQYFYGGLKGAPANKYISIKHLVMELEASGNNALYANLLKKACKVEIARSPKVTFTGTGAFPIDDTFVKEQSNQPGPSVNNTSSTMEFVGVDVTFNNNVTIYRNISFKDSVVTAKNDLTLDGNVSISIDDEVLTINDGTTQVGQTSKLVLNKGMEKTSSGTLHITDANVEMCGDVVLNGVTTLTSTTGDNMVTKQSNCGTSSATLKVYAPITSNKYKYNLDNMELSTGNALGDTTNPCTKITIIGATSSETIDIQVSNTLTLQGLVDFQTTRIDVSANGYVIVGFPYGDDSCAAPQYGGKATFVNMDNSLLTMTTNSTFEIRGRSAMGVTRDDNLHGDLGQLYHDSSQNGSRQVFRYDGTPGLGFDAMFAAQAESSSSSRYTAIINGMCIASSEPGDAESTIFQIFNGSPITCYRSWHIPTEYRYRNGTWSYRTNNSTHTPVRNTLYLNNEVVEINVNSVYSE